MKEKNKQDNIYFRSTLTSKFTTDMPFETTQMTGNRTK